MNNEYLTISDINKIIKYTIEGNDELAQEIREAYVESLKDDE